MHIYPCAETYAEVNETRANTSAEFFKFQALEAGAASEETFTNLEFQVLVRFQTSREDNIDLISETVRSVMRRRMVRTALASDLNNVLAIVIKSSCQDLFAETLLFVKDSNVDLDIGVVRN